MTTHGDPPELTDADDCEREICGFVRDVVAAAGADGVVVGLSGGVDSTVAATLAVEALGSENVYGLLLPTDATADGEVDDARQVAEELVIDHRVLELQPLLDEVVVTLTREVRERDSRTGRGSSRVSVDPVGQRGGLAEAVGNAAARLRMLATYFEADTRNRLVLGTGNRSELLLGYFTKYGGGGVDLLPLGDLYETQVRTLARHLGVRERIVEKPATAGLWAGQTDVAELGAPSEVLDAVLVELVDEVRSVEETAARLGCDPALVRSVAERHERTAHERRPPPTPATREQCGAPDGGGPGGGSMP